MATRNNTVIIAARRARMLRKFRVDMKYRPLIAEVEEQGLSIAPFILINKGYVQTYSRSCVLIEGYRCGVYIPSPLRLTDANLAWKMYALESQLNDLDFALCVVQGRIKYRFFPIPAREILNAYPGRRRVDIDLPVSGRYNFPWQAPSLDYFQFENRWSQFRFPCNKKTALAVPVPLVYSSPA